MAVGNSSSSFRRGAMSLIILSLLKREDMHGYQLVQETGKVSGGRISTQEGALYPVLYKLLDQGLISDRKVLVGRRMTRVYYHLEPAGEKRLREMVQEYKEITQGVFLIIKESEKTPKYADCTVVSMEGTSGDSGRLEEKSQNAVSGDKFSLGLCY